MAAKSKKPNPGGGGKKPNRGKSNRAPADRVRTRQAVLNALKATGSMDAAALGRELGVTAMAVRQHLYDLEAEGLVTFAEEARPRGRPAKLWRLTPAADRFFPDGHAQLTVSLIRSMSEAFGAKGMDKLLAARGKETAADYARKVPKRASLRRRAEALAKIRSEEGYMAEIIEAEDGSLVLLERHCPICEAASECQGLCAMELDVFKDVLGPGVRVERTEHIQAGAQRCAYRIEKQSERQARTSKKR